MALGGTVKRSLAVDHRTRQNLTASDRAADWTTTALLCIAARDPQGASEHTTLLLPQHSDTAGTESTVNPRSENVGHPARSGLLADVKRDVEHNVARGTFLEPQVADRARAIGGVGQAVGE